MVEGQRVSDGSGPSETRSATCSGLVWSEVLLRTDAFAVIRIYFTPGARTFWHSHPGGQVLHTLSGGGVVQERSREVVHLGPGDTFWSEGGVEHWHGATEERLLTQLIVNFGATAWGSEVSLDE